jgi:LacI family transcriptional regulator
VGNDDLLAGELATQHLVDTGRRRIAFIGAASFSPTSDRKDGYLAVLARTGVKISPHYIVRMPRNEESNPVLGAKAMKQLLKLRPRPDAVFCYNDPSAWGASLEILEEGLRIPEDIAILGCGNTSYNNFFRVPLTSVDLNASHMGLEAANLALRLIKDRSEKVKHTPMALLLRPTLVVRDSTGKTGKFSRPDNLRTHKHT